MFVEQVTKVDGQMHSFILVVGSEESVSEPGDVMSLPASTSYYFPGNISALLLILILPNESLSYS
jgi:hypothetical protein